MTEVIEKFWRITAAAVAVIGLAGAIIYIAWTNHKTFEDKEIAMAQHHMLITAKAITRGIQEYIIECQEDIQTLARNTLIRKGLSEGKITPAMEQEVKEVYNAHKKDVDGIYVINPEGVILYRAPFWEDGVDRRGTNYADRPDVAYVLKYDEPYISEVIKTRLGKPAISLSVPVHYMDKFVGVVRWMITIKTIEDHFIRPIKVAAKGYVQLLDNKGSLIVHPKADHVGKHILTPRKEIFPEHDWSDLEYIVEKMTKGEEGVGIYHSAWWTGEKELEIVKKLTAYAPIQVGANLWSIGLVLDYSKIEGPIHEHMIYTFGFAGFLTLLFCAGGLALYKTQKRKAVLEAIAESAAALQVSEERYRDLYENAPNAYFSISAVDGSILGCNTASMRLLGYDKETIMGMKAFDLYADTPDGLSKAQEVFKRLSAGESIRDIELQMKHKNGDPIWISLSVEPVRDRDGNITESRSMVIDISERKRLEGHLQEGQKMEAIATLAGGIAHEFNNTLVGITGNIELLQMEPPDDVNIDKYAERMKASALHMAHLTDQLLAYAQGGKYQPKNISISDFVEETLPLIKQTIDPSIRIETDLPHDIFNVEVDLTQMQIVLSAILSNSAESLEGEGRILITTNNEEIKEEFAKNHPDIKPDPYVSLRVEDDGKGMDEQTQSRVFDPFFTTKIHGRGLGMAAVYGIVRNHGGWISVDSELGKGTVVYIYLPAIKVQMKEEEKPKIEPAKSTGTILVIEDEDVVTDVALAMLEKLGYHVLLAKTGAEAVNLAKSFDGIIDLAILDIVLPDLAAKEVYRHIMEARPDLKVIVCSGYAIDGPPQEILDAGAQDFIQKPFSYATLSEKLKEVLEGK